NGCALYLSDDPETRDAWWAEVRQEIKSHAKALGCHAVVGYSESTSICEEVCILSASGTAAVLNPRFLQDGNMEVCLEPRLSWQPGYFSIGSEKGEVDFFPQNQDSSSLLGLDESLPPGCGFCHIPYDELNMPFPARLAYCCSCRKQKVPDVLFTTIDLPVDASATGVYLAALPTPGGIQIAGKTPNDATYEQHISHMQKKINDTITRNKELYEINPPETSEEIVGSPIPEPRHRTRLLRSQSESSDEIAELDLSHGKKDAFVLEIDDTDAMEDVHSLLTDIPPPSGFYSCNTEIMPGINNWTSDIQMFTSVRVSRLSNITLTNQTLNKTFNDLCENLLKSLYFKLRSMIPCCLCHVNFTVALPEDELVQVTVTAVAITFDKHQALQTAKTVEKNLQRASTDNEEQLQFPLELSSDPHMPQQFSPAKEDLENASSHAGIPAGQRAISLDKPSPLTEGQCRKSGTHGMNSTVPVVKMTLSFIPGAKITKYLGIINMFFIETTSLRVFAMVRAHVAALGGNAVVSYIMKQCVFMENPNKNQAQCLINVSGDAVIFIRESELDGMPAQFSATGSTKETT
ncbi:hypothetical protein E2320_004328, partial [Naja naja]